MESDTNPPQKRRRELDDTGSPGPSQKEHRSLSLEKDKTIWIEDGNIILVCETESQHIGFRFSKGLLSQRCEVFQDMFSVCGASDSEETYEGCPLIVVHDSPADIRRLLMYIVDRYFAKDLTILTFDEITSLLRMSTKYMFLLLRQDIITHLKVLYPSTLTDFLSNTRRELLPKDFNGILGVNIGLECDVPAILPAAYYLCSILKPTQLIDGIKNENTGTLAKLSPGAYRSLTGFQEDWSAEIAVIAGNTYPRSLYCADDIVEFLDCLSSQDISMQNPTHRNQRCFFSFDDHHSISDMCKKCGRALTTRRRRVQGCMQGVCGNLCHRSVNWEVGNNYKHHAELRMAKAYVSLERTMCP